MMRIREFSPGSWAPPAFRSMDQSTVSVPVDPPAPAKPSETGKLLAIGAIGGALGGLVLSLVTPLVFPKFGKQISAKKKALGALVGGGVGGVAGVGTALALKS